MWVQRDNDGNVTASGPTVLFPDGTQLLADGTGTPQGGWSWVDGDIDGDPLDTLLSALAEAQSLEEVRQAAAVAAAQQGGVS